MAIDIPVSVDVQKMLDLPACVDLSLPKATPIKITLPTGGTLTSFADMSKGIPTDCQLTLSLMLQLAPLLGSMDCLLKILKLLGPLVDIVKGLPFPPVEAISKFVQAAVDLAPCLAIPTGTPLIPFVKDILCLIMKVMNCMIDQLKTIAGVLGGLAIQLQLAEQSGNTELLAALKCSQDNANASAQSALGAIEPIGAVLGLVTPVMQLIGQEPIKLPAIGSETDVEALNTVVTTLTGVRDSIQIVADALGGC